MSVNVQTLLLKIIGDSKGGEHALEKINKKLIAFGTALTVASVASLKTFAKLGESGAKLETLERKFDRMARSFGKSSEEMLASWSEAAAGTLSQSEMMRKANQAALLGLPVGEMANLLKIARNASEATGESVEYMFSSLVVGIGRQSKAILDNLGIVFSSTEAYDAHAAAIGKNKEAFTAADKQAAYLSATLKAAARQEAILGEVSESASTQIARSKAAIKDAKDEMSKAFVPVARVVAKVLTALANGFKAIPAPIKKGFASLLGLVAAVGAVIGPLMTLKGLMPLIKLAMGALSTSIGGVVSAMGPLLIILAIVAGAIALLKKAWDENWGGIQETVRTVVDQIKLHLEPIITAVRSWVGEIRKQLGFIMKAVRNLIEPAFARLREIFGGLDMSDFFTTLRDAVNVVGSTISAMLETIRRLLTGSAFAFSPLKDAALNVVTLIVIGWRNYGAKALIWGWNLIVNFANGIIKAAKSVLSKAANFIGGMIARFLAPGSPPKEGPLSGIVEWGKGLMDTYLQGFAQADFGILRDSLAPLRSALDSAVDLGDIKAEDMLGLFREVREDTAALIANFRETGEVSEEALGAIAEKLGEGGEEYTKYLRLMMEHQSALDRLKTVQEEVSEAEARGFVPAELKAKLQAAEDEVDATQKAVDWQREYLDALQDGVDLQREMIMALERLAETMDKLTGKEKEELVAEEAVMPEVEEPALAEEMEIPATSRAFSEEFENTKAEVTQWFKDLPGKVGGWIETIKVKAMEKWIEIKEKLRVILLQILAIIVYQFWKMYDSVRKFLILIVQVVLTKALEMYSNFRAAMLLLVATVLARFLDIYSNVRAFFLMVWTVIVGQLLLWYLRFSTGLTNIKTVFVTKWTEIKTWLGETWSEIITQASEKIDEVLLKISTTLTTIKTTFETIFTEIKTSLGEKWGELVTQASEKIEEFKQIGRDILIGMKEGLIEKWDDIKGWFTEKINALKDMAKGVLGIQSRSQAFFDMGQEIVRGLEAGLDFSGVTQQIQAGVTGMTEGGVAAAGGGSAGGMTVIQFPGGLILPGIRDGRDADSLIREIQRQADDAAARAGVPGGQMT